MSGSKPTNICVFALGSVKGIEQPELDLYLALLPHVLLAHADLASDPANEEVMGPGCLLLLSPLLCGYN